MSDEKRCELCGQSLEVNLRELETATKRNRMSLTEFSGELVQLKDHARVVDASIKDQAERRMALAELLKRALARIEALEGKGP